MQFPSSVSSSSLTRAPGRRTRTPSPPSSPPCRLEAAPRDGERSWEEMKRTFPPSHFHSRSVKFDSGLVFGRKERGGGGENRGGSEEAERKASGAGWGIGRGRRGGGTTVLESRLHILPLPLPSPSFPMEGTLHPLPLLFSPQGTKGRREEGIPPTAHTPMHPPPPSCSQSQSPSSKAPEGRKNWRRPSLDCPRTTTTAKKGGGGA